MPTTKRGKFILGAFVLLLLAPLIKYRLPGGKAVIFEGEVQYQYIDLGQGDMLRTQFEHLLGKRRVFLVDKPWMFVRSSDFERCWPERDMKSANYTISAKFQVYPLLFGGYGLAEVVDIQRLNKPPVVTK